MPSVEIKYFNALTYNEPFFDQPVKNKQEENKKCVEMSINSNYIVGNLLDYLYHQHYDKLIGIGFSRQTNTTFSQQINFTEKI